MHFRYYFFHNGQIVFGDNLAATDLAEAIQSVAVLRDLRHEPTDGFEIWSGREMLYRSSGASRTGIRTLPLPPHVGQVPRLPPITSGLAAR